MNANIIYWMINVATNKTFKCLIHAYLVLNFRKICEGEYSLYSSRQNCVSFSMTWQIKQISTYRKSHILIVPSSLPDTNHFPSLLKAIDVTLLECPSKVASWNHWALPDKVQAMRIHTGSEEVLEMSYIYIFLWIAAAKNRLLWPWAWNMAPSENDQKWQLTRERWLDD